MYVAITNNFSTISILFEALDSYLQKQDFYLRH